MAVQALPLILLAGAAAFLLTREDEEEDDTPKKEETPLPNVTEETTEEVPDPVVEKTVLLYSASWCPSCQRIKAYLDKRGVTFEVRDVDDPAILEELKVKGADAGWTVDKLGGIPVLETLEDGKQTAILMGFDRSKINAAVGIIDLVLTIPDAKDLSFQVEIALAVIAGTKETAMTLGIGSNPGAPLETVMTEAMNRVAEEAELTRDLTGHVTLDMDSDAIFIDVPRGSVYAFETFGDFAEGALVSADKDMYMLMQTNDRGQYLNMLFLRGPKLDAATYDKIQELHDEQAGISSGGVLGSFMAVDIEFPEESDPQYGDLMNQMLEDMTKLIQDVSAGPMYEPPSGGTPTGSGQMALADILNEATATAFA
jgi:thiol-disulfide isomerase/thioredoxin